MKVRIKVAESARRHKIGQAHALVVIRANPPIELSRSHRTTTRAGRMPDSRLVVIHVMPIALRNPRKGTP